MALRDAWYTFTDALNEEMKRLDAEGGDAAELANAIQDLIDSGSFDEFSNVMEEMEKDATPADILDKIGL